MEGHVASGFEYLLKTYGLAGLVIMAQAWWIVKQSKQIEAYALKLEAAYKQAVEDGKTMTTGMLTIAQSMNNLADLIRDRLRPVP